MDMEAVEAWRQAMHIDLHIHAIPLLLECHLANLHAGRVAQPHLGLVVAVATRRRLSRNAYRSHDRCQHQRQHAQTID